MNGLLMYLNGTELVIMLKTNWKCELLDDKCHSLHEQKKKKKRIYDNVYICERMIDRKMLHHRK
jgi:hypothetical protein